MAMGVIGLVVLGVLILYLFFPEYTKHLPLWTGRPFKGLFFWFKSSLSLRFTSENLDLLVESTIFNGLCTIE
jgi:hypothetical protein